MSGSRAGTSVKPTLGAMRGREGEVVDKIKDNVRSGEGDRYMGANNNNNYISNNDNSNNNNNGNNDNSSGNNNDNNNHGKISRNNNKSSKENLNKGNKNEDGQGSGAGGESVRGIPLAVDKGPYMIATTVSDSKRKLNLEISGESFEGVLFTLRSKRNEGRLVHDVETVELLVKANLLAPEGETYPHPCISALFDFEKYEATEDNVASWAGANSLGLRMKRGEVTKKGEIINVYGGRVTDKYGMYVMDVSVAGGPKTWVDGDPSLGPIATLGLINEDIHNEVINAEIDVAGIIYATEEIKDCREVLTTYGNQYDWRPVVQIGYDRLKQAISRFQNYSLALPDKLQGLVNSNPLHAWVKRMIWAHTEASEMHSTIQMGLEGEDEIISFLTAATTFNEYAFRRCGKPTAAPRVRTRDDVGRKFVNYCRKAMWGELITLDFCEVWRRNENIAILRMALLNGDYIRKKTGGTRADVTMVQQITMGAGDPDTLGPSIYINHSDPLTIREQRLISEITGKFDWATDNIGHLDATTLRLGDDPMRLAITDILDGNLCPEQLHSCGIGRDWVGIEGLAAYLRSGEVYQRYNPTLTGVHSRDENTLLRRWCGGYMATVKIATLMRINLGAKRLATEMKAFLGGPTLRCGITGEEEFSCKKGRVRATIAFGTGQAKRRLIDNINSSAWGLRWKNGVKSLPMWKVEIDYDKKENTLPSDGYDGYIALAQLSSDRTASLKEGKGRKEVSDAIRGILAPPQLPIRPDWRIMPKSRRSAQEIALGVAEYLERADVNKPLAWRLLPEDWLSPDLAGVLCTRWGYSLWVVSEGTMNMVKNHLGISGPLTENEVMDIFTRMKLVRRNKSYYVTSCDLSSELTAAMDDCVNQLNLAISDSQTTDNRDLRPGVATAFALLADGLDPATIDLRNPSVRDTIRDKLSRSNQSKGARELDSILVSGDLTGSAPISREALIEACKMSNTEPNSLEACLEDTQDERTGATRGVMESISRSGDDRLRVLFWNSNGWDIDRGRRLADVAKEENIHVIGVVDVKIKKEEADRKLATFKYFLEMKTGIKWSGKVFPLDVGCLSGGAIMVSSDQFMDTKYQEILPFGMLSMVHGSWGKHKIKVALIYRPSDDKGDKSLGKSVRKVTNRDTDASITAGLAGASAEGELLLGGDFNLDTISADRLLIKAGMARSICAPSVGGPTFRRKYKDTVQESAIDHVAWTGRCLAGVDILEDGRFTDDHIPLIGWVDRGKPPDVSVREKFQWAPSFSASDERSILRYTKELESIKEEIGLSGLRIPEIIKIATIAANKIGERRSKRRKPGGWSPVARLLELEMSVLGTAIKVYGKLRYHELIPKRLKQTSNDIKKLTLTEDETIWLEDNLKAIPLGWTEWKSEYPTKFTLLSAYVDRKAALTEQRRRDLRLLHGGRMRKMQEAADEGRVGALLKHIVGSKPPFSLECIRVGTKNITDAYEITRLVTEWFREWFHRGEKEAWRDHAISDAIICEDRDRFMEVVRSLGVPSETADKIWDSCRRRESPAEAACEMEALDEYTPSLAEFKAYIKCSNPRSAGGFNGMSYLLMMHLPDEYVERMYECLIEAWETRTPIEGWGDRWLVPIPKIADPALKDLRPLMLVDVVRKIWIGLLMDKIQAVWVKWGMFDEAQHGFMAGKGTHTAIPHLIDLFETARNSNSSLYISSWDIVRAFDSLGRETVVMALLRMHVPRILVNYVTSQDGYGRVYVRTPLNYKKHTEGSVSQLRVEDGFKTGKGVGQGDGPSPLLWAAAFDTLLCALKFLNTRFAIMDLDHNSHVATDVCYADDLISGEVSLCDLQLKADVVSGWAIIMGVKISHAKFRTFGMDWGTKRKATGKLIIHIEGWAEVLVDVRSDGILTHLGIVWNTDYKNKELWTSIQTKIENLGWQIARTWVRAGDKLLAMQYCLNQDICYRLQFANWPLSKYRELDKEYMKIVRRVTKNMDSYPAAAIMAGRKEGGLGITPPSALAQYRKLRIVLKALSKGGATAAHIESLFRIELEKAGTGGLPGQHVVLQVMRSRHGFLTSLLEWLDEIELGFCIQGLVYNSPMASWIRRKPEGKNGRERFEMRGEMDEIELIDSRIPLRAGQIWDCGDTAFEIVSFNSANNIKVKKWTNNAKRISPGANLVRDRADNAGAGASHTVSYEELLRRAKGILKTAPLVTRMDDRVISVEKRLPRKPIWLSPKVRYADEWGRLPFEFDEIYTDGSWSESATAREYLAGRSTVRTGGAVVLCKEGRWFPIFVEMDFDIDSAFDAELISLLIAVLMAGDKKVTIYTDCKSAMGVVTGGEKGNYLSLLSSWKVPSSCTIEKIKAHPERMKTPEMWTRSEKGIWMADQIAGRTIRGIKKARASEWLKKISSLTKICLVDKKNVPFVGDLARRWSKHFVKRYFIERDEYREERGSTRKWEGTNMALSHKAMGKGPGIADLAATQRLGLDKRWKWNWARGDTTCLACGRNGSGISHPLRHCREESTVGERGLIKFKARVAIDQARLRVRPLLEELWRNMEVGIDGAYACCGVFTRGFINGLTRADLSLGKEDIKDLNKFLKVIGLSSRELLRKHGEIGRLNETLADLRQTPIKQYMEVMAPAATETTPTFHSGGRINKNSPRPVGGRRKVTRKTRSAAKEEPAGLPSSAAVLTRLSKCIARQGNYGWVW